MKQWEVAIAQNQDQAKNLGDEGWEPFAVRQVQIPGAPLSAGLSIFFKRIKQEEIMLDE